VDEGAQTGPETGSRLDPYRGVIDGWLRQDLDATRKQQHAVMGGAEGVMGASLEGLGQDEAQPYARSGRRPAGRDLDPGRFR
jgi:hypothetical protein